MPFKKEKYPDNWLTEIRPTILTRDKFKCKHCGVKDRSHYVLRPSGEPFYIETEDIQLSKKSGLKVKRVVLTIAHLDQDTYNNDYNNLAALCQRCHLAHDKPFNVAKRLAAKKVR